MRQATESRNESAPDGAGTPALALLEPERPHNLGAAIRLCACLGVPLHVIGPCGFPLTDRRIREAALDYGAHLEPRLHPDVAAFLAWSEARGRRLVLLTTRAAEPAHRVRYGPADLLLVGSERAGAPAWLHERAALRVRVPMAPARRALNLVLAGAIVLGEALRQSGHLDALEAARRPAEPGDGGA